MPTETSAALRAVLDQIDELAGYYQDYSEESTRLENQVTGLQRIGAFFSGSKRFSNDSMHTKFYEGVQARVPVLEASIAALPDRAEAAQAAERAVAIILDPIPEEDRDVGGWMRFAAEPLCQPLLVYLERDTLQAIYDRYNLVYPKRLQFPAQVKLRKAMEKLLKK
ncbi:MAG: hypothetical protein ACI3VN_07240 [Candidatus Onthomonas sp.]